MPFQVKWDLGTLTRTFLNNLFKKIQLILYEYGNF